MGSLGVGINVAGKALEVFIRPTEQWLTVANSPVGLTVCLAKTAALDAPVLAHFTEAIRPPVRIVPDVPTRELAKWVQSRYQIVEMITAERHRRGGMLARWSRNVNPVERLNRTRCQRLSRRVRAERCCRFPPSWKTTSASSTLFSAITTSN